MTRHGQPPIGLRGWVNLGVLREDQGDLDGAERAYQLAIDSGHPLAAPCAREVMMQLRGGDDAAGGADALCASTL